MTEQSPEYVGNYKVIRELGRGSMGTVYRCVHESLGRDLAVKLLAPEYTRDGEFLERFRREGQIAAKLRHPHIVQVYDFSDRDGIYFIAMEYLGARNLKTAIEEAGGKLPMAQALRVADQLLQALEHAHSHGVVHRDVKPANIILTDDNNVALTDFSVAQMKFANRLTQTWAALGTPEYMAPEQFDNKGVGAWSDIYALSIVLYEMLTGEHPFRGETVGEVMKHQFFKQPEPVDKLMPEVSAALNAVIMKGLQKSPDDRYKDASSMRKDLALATDGQVSGSVDQFLADVASGKISLDDANLAREKVKEAIDRGYRKMLTILMVDLAGSSKIKVPNQTLHADRAFRDYRSTINTILKSHGCTSFEWSGDGAICIFEEPLPAVEAALEIQANVDAVGSRHTDLPDKLRARIGVNTGEVYLDPRRGLGEFASRTVDQAGHLEKDCPVGAVHVGQATMAATCECVAYDEVGVNRDGIMVYLAHPKAEVVEAPTPTPAPVPPVGAATAKYCPGCGQAVIAQSRYCHNCGFDMGSLTHLTAGHPEPEKPPEPVNVPKNAPPEPVVAAAPATTWQATINQRGPKVAGWLTFGTVFMAGSSHSVTVGLALGADTCLFCLSALLILFVLATRGGFGKAFKLAALCMVQMALMLRELAFFGS